MRSLCALSIAAVFLQLILCNNSEARKLNNYVCDLGDSLCATACMAAGGSYYKYYCDSDQCGCSDNPVSACFPGKSSVLTPYGPKMMKDLVIGDDVLTVTASGAAEFNKVFMFTSYRPEVITEFVTIETTAGANITLTPSHFIFGKKRNDASATNQDKISLESWSYMLPSDLEIGDFVLATGSDDSTARPAATRVKSLKKVIDVGIYNPHTRSGAIVIDGVVASEVTAFVPKWIAGHAFHRAFMGLLRGLFTLVPRQLDTPIASLMAKVAGHGVSDILLNRDAFFATIS